MDDTSIGHRQLVTAPIVDNNIIYNQLVIHWIGHTNRAYGAYWYRVLEILGSSRGSEIKGLVEWLKVVVVVTWLVGLGLLLA